MAGGKERRLCFVVAMATGCLDDRLAVGGVDTAAETKRHRQQKNLLIINIISSSSLRLGLCKADDIVATLLWLITEINCRGLPR